MSEDTMTIVEFSENIEDAEAPEPLPPGEYPATIRQVAVLRSKQRDTLYAAVQFVILPEDYPADYAADNAPDGKVITFRRVSMEDNPQARWQIKNFCEAIGATASKRIDVTEWVSLEARVTVDNEEYEGVMREQIVKVDAA